MAYLGLALNIIFLYRYWGFKFKVTPLELRINDQQVSLQTLQMNPCGQHWAAPGLKNVW